SVTLHRLELLQADIWVSYMTTGVEMEFIPVPRTDDVHIIVVISLSGEQTFLREKILDSRSAHAFAGRPTLVRADVPVAINLALAPKQSDFDAVVAPEQNPALLEGFRITDQDF